ncbi:RRP15-like protein [Mercenaria mercenaria]|uniref:RRP15-like protein n=1 Tax=Mercenaria mercenaria TaxID=6596 RepID=UPI00234F482F|nr:RRP15-like protein [Mercenaria mercenaria]
MAAPMSKKVHVEIEASESEPEREFEESSTSEEKDTSSDEEKNEPTESSTGGKTGLADVLAKILHKNVPSHKQVILSKGKTDKEIQKRKLEREEEDTENKSAKLKTESTEKEPQIAREEKVKLWENMCRIKPDPLDRVKERQLQKIATRGVVQLFNAVRKQQKVLEEKIQQVGTSERKKDKIMEGMTKDKFLTILKGTSKTNVKSEKLEVQDQKTSIKNSDSDSDSGDKSKNSGKTWNILKDDYMMGAKMKDWDKEESNDDDDSGPDDPDLSDSD